MRGRSGTVIVAVVMGLGLVLGVIGAWWVVHARPHPGDFIDVLAVPEGAIVVRKEKASEHSFLEVYDGSHLRWRGMIPHYAGHVGVPAIGASHRSITVRVVRRNHPYVFAFDAATGAKIDSFDLTPEAPPDPNAYTLPTVATVSARGLGAEILATPGGKDTLVIGVALDERRLAWKRTIPGVATDAWIWADMLVVQTVATRAALALSDGTDRPPPTGDIPPHQANVAGGRRWNVTPREINVIDDATHEAMATIR